MQKKELAERLARKTKQTTAAAADQLDDVIHNCLRNLRHPDSKLSKPDALQQMIEDANCRPQQKGRHARP